MSRNIAVVTGASYGLGEVICKELLAKNIKVYGVSRTEPSIKNPLFVWLKADLTISSAISKIVNAISENSIDILVNNAGTAFEKAALDFSDKDYAKMFGLNFVAPIRLTVSLFPKLSKGLIINISSTSDRYPDPLWALYGSSKAALNIYFETIASEHPNTKIINLLPTYIDTPLQHQVNDNNKGFAWDKCMKSKDVAGSVGYILDHSDELDSGSRVIVTSDLLDDGDYNPEKLWVYNVDSKKIKRADNI